MIVLGIILLVIGAVVGNRLLVNIGVALALIGLVLDVLAGMYHVGVALF